MTHGGKITLGQAILIACLFCAPGAANAPAQSRSITPSPSDYNQTSPADQAKGRALLDSIRSSAIDGDIYFDFQIRLRPKRGATTLIPGRLWGSRNALGPITRITLWPGSPGDQRDLIIQNGPQSTVWTSTPQTTSATITTTPGAAAPTVNREPGTANRAEGAPPGAMFEPLAGTDLTAFELQMPFIYWDDFTYEGLKAGNQRVTHAFLMRPPPAVAAAQPNLAGVRIYYDEGYRVITVFEILGPGGVVTKTMRLKDFHLVAGQFMLRKAELRNEATGNGTDFNVLMTGVKLTLPRDIFSPEKISTPAAPPPIDQLWKSR